jgi:hypothetical protein
VQSIPCDWDQGSLYLSFSTNEPTFSSTLDFSVFYEMTSREFFYYCSHIVVYSRIVLVISTVSLHFTNSFTTSFTHIVVYSRILVISTVSLPFVSCEVLGSLSILYSLKIYIHLDTLIYTLTTKIYNIFIYLILN